MQEIMFTFVYMFCAYLSKTTNATLIHTTNFVRLFLSFHTNVGIGLMRFMVSVFSLMLFAVYDLGTIEVRYGLLD